MPIPLCGKAGKLFHGMMRWMGLEEGDFYLTNTVKEATFKPGSSYVRPPTEEEILKHRKDLILEIAKVSPKIIFTLGKEALWSLCYHEKESLDEMGIGKHVGEHHTLEINITEALEMDPHESGPIIHKLKVIPLYHPSAILRDEDNSKGYKERVTKVLNENQELISNSLGRFLL
jgi:uracil-DNA glycosylase family 4